MSELSPPRPRRRGHDVCAVKPAASVNTTRRSPAAGRKVLPFINTVTHRGRRGARLARREEEENREYLTDEQRSEAGCIAGRMPPDS